MPGPEGTITVDGDRKNAHECEEGDLAYAESACTAEEFYETNIDQADMTPLKNPTTEVHPLLKFISDEDTK